MHTPIRQPFKPSVLSGIPSITNPLCTSFTAMTYIPKEVYSTAMLVPGDPIQSVLNLLGNAEGTRPISWRCGNQRFDRAANVRDVSGSENIVVFIDTRSVRFSGSDTDRLCAQHLGCCRLLRNRLRRSYRRRGSCRYCGDVDMQHG